jgi:O-antigen/teichoic acid export membrane protein
MTGSAAPPDDDALTGNLRPRFKRVALASGAALVIIQLVLLAQTVALARLLGPAGVGLFVAGTALTAAVTWLVEGGTRAALVQREDRLEDAANSIFWGTAASGLLIALGALISAPILGMIFESRTAGLIAAVTSGVLLLRGLINVPEAMLQRNFSVARRIVVGPAVAITNAVVSVALAVAGLGPWSMVIGWYASEFVLVVSVWAICGWRPGRGTPSFKLWRELARYGFPLVLGMVGSGFQTFISATVVGRVLGTPALGQYRYARRVAQLPVSVLIDVGSVALFPMFSRLAKDRARLETAYTEALRWAMIGGAAMSAFLIAVGEPAVVAAFGEQWRGAGVAVVAMAGLGIGKAFTCVSEEVIKGCGRTALLNWYTLVEVSVGIGLLLVLVWPFGLVGVGLAISFTAIIVGVFNLRLARAVVDVSPRQILAAVLPPIPCALAALAAVWPLEHILLRSDTRSLAPAIGLLAIDGIVFVIVFLVTLSVIAPSSVGAILAAVRRRTPFGRPRSLDQPTPVDVNS